MQAAFGDWARPDSPAPALLIPDVPAPAQAPKPQLIVLPDAPQTSLLFGYNSGLTRDSPDFYAAEIMNYVVGGDTFGARLGKTIRDQNGLAYSVYSSIDAQHGSGPFEVFVGANPKNATRALSCCARRSPRCGSTASRPMRSRQAKLYLTGEYPLRLETNAGVA